MLQTINGFDFLLVLIIAGMYLKIYKLDRECESYVEQIIDIARDNYELSQLKYPHMPEPPSDHYIYGDTCNYCLEISGFACTCVPF